MTISNIQNGRKLMMALLITALCMSSTRAWSSPITIDIQGVYAIPGGVNLTGNDTVHFDTETGEFTGTLNSEPVAIAPIIKTIVIIVCLIFCTSKKEGTPEDPEEKKSLLNLALGDLSEIVNSDFGAAGSAIFTSRLVEDTSGITALITGDLTNIDFSMLPTAPSTFDATADARITGTGPGNASGVSIANVLGLSISSISRYTSLGDPNSIFDDRVFYTTLSIADSGPMGHQISGQTTATAIPEPSTANLIGLALCVIAFFKRRQNSQCQVRLRLERVQN